MNAGKKLQMLSVSTVRYKVGDEMLPSRLTIKQCAEFARNRGMDQATANVLALQERASSMINRLGVLIAQGGDPELIAAAEGLVSTWNSECEEFFRGK